MTRTAPHDMAAEQAVIGAVLLAPHLLTDLADQLIPDDFYRPAHSQIWTALIDRHRAGEPTDPIALTVYLAETGCCPAFRMPMKAALWMPTWWDGNAPPVVFRRGVGRCGVVVRGQGVGVSRRLR